MGSPPRDQILERHGISEVWYVDIEARRIEQLTLEDGAYGSAAIHELSATVRSTAVDGLTLSVDELLESPWD